MKRAVWLAPVAVALVLALPSAAQRVAHVHVHDERGAGSNPELERQLEEVRRATERYRDHGVAVAEGFKQFGAEGPLMGEHWYHPDRVKAPLDLANPSTLQYARIGGTRQLVGVAYTLYRRPDDPMPEGFAGDEDRWHVHDVMKLAHALTADRPVARFLVDLGIRRGRGGAGAGRTHLTMVHAWPWLDNPDGEFAQTHRALPYLRAGFPASYAESADEAAAWGVSLLMVGTCRAEVKRVNFLAQLSTDQRSRLHAACTSAASEVRAAAATKVSAERLNGAASRAWRQYLRAQSAILSEAQRERLTATVEHEHAMGGG